MNFAPVPSARPARTVPAGPAPPATSENLPIVPVDAGGRVALLPGETLIWTTAATVLLASCTARRQTLLYASESVTPSLRACLRTRLTSAEYDRNGTEAIPIGPDRRAVGAGRAARPAGKVGRADAVGQHAGGVQRHPVPEPDRVPVAVHPPRPAEQEHGPALLRPVPGRRDVGAGPRPAPGRLPGRRREGAHAVRRRPRQPDGQDDGKRGPAAGTTRARRPPAASGTSPWTRRG